MKILITGATGFIGKRLTRKLASEGHELHILVRKDSKEKAREIFSDLPELHFIEGDITFTDVLSDIYSVSHRLDQIDCLVHLAALYQLDCTRSEAYLMNVVGTQNILNLLPKMKNLKHFHYFSTYAVNPSTFGIVEEKDLSRDDKSFHDLYAKTKNDAEHLVRNLVPDHVTTVIHRPGVIIGDSTNGSMDKTDGPYYFFDFVRRIRSAGPVLKKLGFLPLPVLKDAALPMLPVDHLVDWSTTIINQPPQRKLSTYHLVSQERIPTVEFLEESMRRLEVPLKVLPIGMGALFAPLFPVLKLPREIIFYMQQGAQFKRDNLEQDYPQLKATSFRDYLPKLIEGYERLKS